MGREGRVAGSERRTRERKVFEAGLKRRKRRVVWEFGWVGIGERRMVVVLEVRNLTGQRVGGEGGGGGGNKWWW